MTVSAPGGQEGMCVEVERRGAFWFVRLNRPHKRNALSEPLLAALSAACGQVEADAGARGVVLWGAGGHFCAGADFGHFEALLAAEPQRGELGSDPDFRSTPEPDTIATHNRTFGRVLERLLSLPVPTLGVVRGAAMGGGCGLAASLDRVIAADDAVFAMPEVTLGVAPAQIAAFVARRTGVTRARWLMLSAAKLDAAGALAAGLADVVSPAGGLAGAVEHELRALAVAEPAALRTTKRLLTLATTLPLTDALDGAAREFAALLRHGAAREGIAATRARRPPAWHAAVPTLPEFD
jgi:isohexenylglutaconyl-CoA hydratase